MNPKYTSPKFIRKNLMQLTIFFTFVTFCCLTNCKPDAIPLKLNDLQAIGSHNSYKKAIQPELITLLEQRDSQIIHLAYEHLPVKEQLEMGLRKLEIDIYHDPEGGRYNKPMGNELLNQNGLDAQPLDTPDSWNTPGFKVFHVQDIDFRTHCILLSDCLQSILNWSNDNPRHIPVVITINVKTEPLDDPNSIPPLPFDESTYVQLEQEIQSIFGRNHLLLPDDVQAGASSLNASVLANGWPSITASAGKFIFVLDEPMAKIETYLRATLPEDRLLFTNVPPGHPESAFIIANDPIVQEMDIVKWVKQGYLVRTRADANTMEAREDDYSRFEAAKRSGAQYISTDYYFKTSTFPDFLIRFEGNTFVRCNPVLDKEGCTVELNKLELWDL